MSRYRIPIFPVSIFQSSVRDNSRIQELVYPMIKKSSGKHDNPPDGWLTNKLITSFNDDDFNESIISDDGPNKEIKDQYIEVMGSFFNTSFECEIKDIWYNYYIDQEYQESHTHFGDYNDPNHYACVHFLSFNPEIHSPLTFEDPLKLVRSTSHEMTGFSGYSDKFRVNAKQGDLVMFPAYLEHEVKAGPPTPEYPRITISFNVKITKFGDDIEENGPS
jgi:hypothetical protein